MHWDLSKHNKEFITHDHPFGEFYTEEDALEAKEKLGL